MVINMYDEENVDYESQITNRVFDELETEEQNTILTDKESSPFNEDNEDIDKKSFKVTKSTLLYEIKLSEKKRNTIIFLYKPKNIIYEGIVYGQDSQNPDKFMFKVKEYKSKDNILKCKIIKFNDIKNLRYK